LKKNTETNENTSSENPLEPPVNNIEVNTGDVITKLETTNAEIIGLKEAVMTSSNIDRAENEKLVEEQIKANQLAEVVRKENREARLEQNSDDSNESGNNDDNQEEDTSMLGGFVKNIKHFVKNIGLFATKLIGFAGPLLIFASMFDGILKTLEEGWNEWHKSGSVVKAIMLMVKNILPNIGNSVLDFVDNILNWTKDALGFTGPDINIKKMFTDLLVNNVFPFIEKIFDGIIDTFDSVVANIKQIIRKIPGLGDFGKEDTAADRLRTAGLSVGDKTDERAAAAQKKLGISTNTFGFTDSIKEKDKIAELSTEELRALIVTDNIDADDKKAIDAEFEKRMQAISSSSTTTANAASDLSTTQANSYTETNIDKSNTGSTSTTNNRNTNITKNSKLMNVTGETSNTTSTNIAGETDNSSTRTKIVDSKTSTSTASSDLSNTNATSIANNSKVTSEQFSNARSVVMNKESSAKEIKNAYSIIKKAQEFGIKNNSASSKNDNTTLTSSISSNITSANNLSADNIKAASQTSNISNTLSRVETETTQLKEEKIQREKETLLKAEQAKGDVNISNNTSSITNNTGTTQPVNYIDPVTERLRLTQMGFA